MKNTVETYTPELARSERLLLSYPNKFSEDGNLEYHSPFKGETILRHDLRKEQLMKKDSSLKNLMELPVNNFLKTFKEIEAEFYYVFSSIKTAITEIPDNLDSFGRMMKKTETSFHLNTAGLEISGHMEENY